MHLYTLGSHPKPQPRPSRIAQHWSQPGTQAFPPYTCRIVAVRSEAIGCVRPAWPMKPEPGHRAAYISATK